MHKEGKNGIIWLEAGIWKLRKIRGVLREGASYVWGGGC
jgi:hypothetical protein